MDVYTYDPSQTELLISGYKVIGWDEIRIKRTSPAFKMVKGINGKHTRVQDYDSSAILSVGIMQTSPSNETLSYVHEQDILNGTGRLQILLKDLGGESVFSSEEAYIDAYPEAKFTDGILFNTWTIVCQSTDQFIVGGNARPSENTISDVLKRLDIL